MSGARPPSKHPATKTDIAAMNRGLRPSRSPSFPYTGITTVPAKTYAVVTHNMRSTPPSSPTMVGRAAENMV
jgi:hypothetical protein